MLECALLARVALGDEVAQVVRSHSVDGLHWLRSQQMRSVVGVGAGNSPNWSWSHTSSIVHFRVAGGGAWRAAVLLTRARTTLLARDVVLPSRRRAGCMCSAGTLSSRRTARSPARSRRESRSGRWGTRSTPACTRGWSRAWAPGSGRCQTRTRSRPCVEMYAEAAQRDTDTHVSEPAGR